MNRQILRAQLGPIIRELEKDNTASFTFADGELDYPPAPQISKVYKGPYLSFYKWPLTTNPGDESTYLDAIDQIYEVIEEEGPFDAILGFSHGATLAYQFLANHAKMHPLDPPFQLFRCAIFLCGLHPFKDDGSQLVYEEGLDGLVRLPTLHVVGKNDPFFKSSVDLYRLCDKDVSQVIYHDQEHNIPVGVENTRVITKAIKDLDTRVIFC